MAIRDGLKSCQKCKTDKPTDNFYQSKTRPDGCEPYCKACHAAKHAARKARNQDLVRKLGREGAARWRERHPERAAASAGAYLARKRAAVEASKPKLPPDHKACAECKQVLPFGSFCKDKRKANGIGSYCVPCDRGKQAERAKRYWSRHAERLRAANNERRRKPEAKAWAKEWRQREHVREIYRLRDQVRVGRMRAEGAGITRKLWQAIKAAFGNCCCYCGAGGRMTLEHLTPANRGGRNEVGNIAPACRRCNSAKQDRLLEEFAPERADEIRRVARLECEAMAA